MSHPERNLKEVAIDNHYTTRSGQEVLMDIKNGVRDYQEYDAHSFRFDFLGDYLDEQGLTRKEVNTLLNEAIVTQIPTMRQGLGVRVLVEFVPDYEAVLFEHTSKGWQQLMSTAD